MSRDELKALQPVQTAFAEAEQQLTRYRNALEDLYGDVLRLHTTTVVSIGYERMVWE